MLKTETKIAYTLKLKVSMKEYSTQFSVMFFIRGRKWKGVRKISKHSILKCFYIGTVYLKWCMG